MNKASLFSISLLALLVCTFQRTDAQCASSPTISGTFSNVCPYAPFTYTTESGMTNYTWVVDLIEGTIISGQGTSSVSVYWMAETGSNAISVNYTDGSNCTSAFPTVENVTVKSVPSVAVAGDSQVNAGSINNQYSVDPGHSSYSWTLFTNPPGGPEPGQITSGTFTNTATVVWNYPGTYYIISTYFDSGSGCIVSGSKLVEVVPVVPTPVISGSTSVCQNTTAFYSCQSGYTNYNWQVNGGSIVSGAGTSLIQVAWNTAGSHSISLNFMAGGTLTSTSATSVIVNPFPFSPTMSGAFSDICLGTFATPEIYSTEAGMINYEWSISSGGYIVSGLGSNSVSVVWATIGPHSISVKYTNPNGGCQSTTLEKSVTMTSDPVSLATITGNTTVCPAGSTGNIYTTESGKSSYEWVFYAVSVSGQTITFTEAPSSATITSGNGTNSVTLTWNNTGIYMIVVAYPDLVSDCKSIGLLSVVVDNVSTQTISFSSIPPLTYGQAPITLNAATFSALPISFQSLDPNVALISGNQLTPTGAGTTTIIASQPGNDCFNAAQDVSQTLIVNKANQYITFNSLSPICQLTPVTLGATSSSSLPITYTSSNPSIAAINNNIVTPLAPGTVTITASQPGNANYSAAISIARSLTVYSLPSTSITLSGPTSFCIGGSVTLSAIAGNSYLWSTGATTQSITASTSGDYSVTVTNSNGCTATSTAINVIVNSMPIATITPGGATTFCSGSSVTLTASSGSSYLWSNGATTQSINVATSGNYTVSVTNASGCSTISAVTTITVLPLPTATIAPSGMANCRYSPFPLTASEGSSYLWSTGETTQTIDVMTTGSYHVTVTNINGCTSMSAPTNVTIRPAANITVNGPTEFCNASQNNSTVLTANSGNSYQYNWSTGQSSQSISVNSAGSYRVGVTDTSTGCTTWSSWTTIQQINPPAVTIVGSNTFCQGGHTELQASVSELSTFQWSHGPNTAFVNISNPGYYYVIATGVFSGCISASAPIQVIAKQNLGGVYITSSQPCLNESVTLNAFPNHYSSNRYLWSNGQTGKSISVSMPGNYSVEITGGSTKIGCIDIYPCFYARIRTPEQTEETLSDIDSLNVLKITSYPNPVDNELNVVLEKSVQVYAEVALTELSGKILAKRSIQKGDTKTTIITENIPDGIYILAILSDSRKKYLKVIVRHGQ